LLPLKVTYCVKPNKPPVSTVPMILPLLESVPVNVMALPTPDAPTRLPVIPPTPLVALVPLMTPELLMLKPSVTPVILNEPKIPPTPEPAPVIVTLPALLSGPAGLNAETSLVTSPNKPPTLLPEPFTLVPLVEMLP